VAEIHRKRRDNVVGRARDGIDAGAVGQAFNRDWAGVKRCKVKGDRGSGGEGELRVGTVVNFEWRYFKGGNSNEQV